MTERATRRPGRRADLDVPHALTQAAERMFGESGVDAVSLRAVARAAGVAPAAVSYHFPTKESLVVAVLGRRGSAVGTSIRQELSRLREQPGQVTMRAVVEAIVQPLVRLVADDPEGGLNWLKIAAWSALSENAAHYDSLIVEPSLATLFDEAVASALGPRERPLSPRRAGIAMFGLLNALAAADMQGYRAIGPGGFDPSFIEELVSFTTAGLLGDDR